MVDDGSTDETQAVLERLKCLAPFPIRTVLKENGGKHTALNAGVRSCSGEFVLILDSDDTLVCSAIQTLSNVGEQMPPDLAGVIGNQVNADTGEVVGKPIPSSVLYTTGNELFSKHGVQGDTMRMYRRSVLIAIPFPVFEGEKFMPENVVWDRIDQLWSLRAIPNALYRSSYRNDGYSNNVLQHRKNSPRGFALALESSAFTTASHVFALKRTIAYQIWNKNVFGHYGWSGFRRKFLFLEALLVSACLRSLRRPRFLFP